MCVPSSLLLTQVTCAGNLWYVLLAVWASIFKSELLVMLSESKILENKNSRSAERVWYLSVVYLFLGLEPHQQ